MNRQSYPRKAKCAHCRTQYLKKSMGHVACGPSCAIEVARLERLKRERKQLQEAKRDAQPISYWLSRTKTACNAYIRLRDSGDPCISCGTWDTVQWEAGHFIPVGRNRALRFDERNIHKQCHHCNVQRSGNPTPYEVNLRRKIGDREVEAIKVAPQSHKWTREELQGLEAHYKAKTRELQKEAA